MAVIKIPSKHIYEKDNQKVVDNVVDTIEVQVQQPSIVTKEQTVFSEEITPARNFYGAQQEEYAGYGATKSNTDYTLVFFTYGYVTMIPTYSKYKIKIPISGQSNYYIQKIVDGKSNSGNANIQYSCVGDKKVGKSTGSMQMRIRPNTPNSILCYLNGVGMIGVSKPSNYDTIEHNISIDFDSIKDIDMVLTWQDNSEYKHITLELNNLTDVSNAKAIKTEDGYFELEFQILTGLVQFETNGKLENTDKNIYNEEYIYGPLSGTYTDYTATNVSLTVNGIIVGLDLTNETLKIGDGKNIMSFQGNELIQTTNTPSVETQCQAVITEWQNGKETATLTCDIADYYDEAGNLVISANGDDTLPMTFHVGDTVVPYVYGANGADKPMSTYADGTPKVFTVIGKHTSKSGAVWQEITLQEKTD